MFLGDAIGGHPDQTKHEKKAQEIVDNPDIREILCQIFRDELSDSSFKEALEFEIVRCVTSALTKTKIAETFSIERDVHLYSLITHKLLERGIESYCRSGNGIEDEDYDQAIEDFTNLIAIDPEDARAYCDRGFAYICKGDFDRAINDLNEAIELNPEDADAYYRRAIAHESKEDYDRAILDTNKVIALNPGDADAYHLRGNAHIQKRDFDQAVEDYTKIIALDPELADAYYRRGCAYVSKKCNDQAIMDFDEAINLDPTLGGAYYNRGVTYDRQGEHERATEDYEKAIQLDSRFEFVRGYIDKYVEKK